MAESVRPDRSPAEPKLYVYWCPRCQVQAERPWHLCRRGPALIPQMDEETECERIEVVPLAASPARPDRKPAERVREALIAAQTVIDETVHPRTAALISEALTVEPRYSLLVNLADLEGGLAWAKTAAHRVPEGQTPESWLRAALAIVVADLDTAVAALAASAVSEPEREAVSDAGSSAAGVDGAAGTTGAARGLHESVGERQGRQPASLAVSEPEPAGAQSTQTVDVRDMRVKAFAQIEVDVDVVFCDDRDVLFSEDIAAAVAKHLGPGVVVHDVDEWEAIAAVSEGPAEASVADSANTAETRGAEAS